jgi:hypothetical protein
MGAAVTVAARKDADRNMLRALGYGAANPAELRHVLAAYRVIFNTVPAVTLDENQVTYCRRNCLKRRESVNRLFLQFARVRLKSCP